MCVREHFFVTSPFLMTTNRCPFLGKYPYELAVRRETLRAVVDSSKAVTSPIALR